MDHSIRHPVPHLLPAQLLTRALEGEHRWGFVDLAPADRGAWEQKRLTVFPPGTTSAERRALKRHRDWPIAGAVITMFLMLVLGEWWPPAVSAGVAIVAYGVSLGVSAHLTHPLRSQCLRVEVTALASVDGYPTTGDIATLNSAVRDLTALEAQFERGELTPVEFELAWARVYDRLPAGTEVTA